MADTTFIDYSTSTPIMAAWLNDVNALTYNKVGSQVNPLNVDRIEPVTATVAGNNLTVGLNPTSIDFRSATLTTGVPNTRQVGVALSMTALSGGTLGTTSAVQATLLLLAIDNAGTVELAIVNPISIWDESGVINTTAVSTGSTSADVAYSTVARTGVPYRIVGFINTTQTTAGVWITPPSLVQGAGGFALASQRVTAIYAKVAGLTTQQFAVANATTANQAVNLGQAILIRTANVTPLPVASGSVVANHSLGYVPVYYKFEVVCLVAELGFSVGDVADTYNYISSSGIWPTISWANSTQVGMHLDGSIASYLGVWRKDTGAYVALTAANWASRFVLR